MQQRFLRCGKVPNNAFALSFVLKILKPATETYQLLKQAKGKNAMGRTQVFEWFRPFKEGTPGTKQNNGHVTVVFFYSDGIVHHEYAPDGQTINKDFYVEVLRLLHESIR